MPEEGQAAWQNFEPQHFEFDIGLPDANLAGDTGETAAAGKQAELEPAGGLHRGERAELVAIMLWEHSVFLKQQSGQGTTPGIARYQTQWVRSDGVNFEEFIDNQPTTGGEADAFVSLNVAQNSEAHLFFAQATTQTPFNDTVNGTGGGGSSLDDPIKMIRYRDMFGWGPVLEPEETVEIFANLTTDQIDTETVNAITEATLVWDVWETPERDAAVRNVER